LVVDVSRHMNRILEINPEGRWVRVQAGVVKDQLNAGICSSPVWRCFGMGDE
jgi:(R)-2-hydroxyglutarate dehydrogenase